MADDVKMILRYRVEANAPLQYQKPILLMEGDKRANVLEVSLFDGEKAVDLTGLSVGGSVMRADGADVDIEGAIDGNVITCVLNEYAYAVAGPFKAYVQLLDSLGEVKRTVLLLAGMVEARGHGPQIDTGKELPSLDDILAQLETMKTVTQQANTATSAANTAAGAANSAASSATSAASKATTAAGTANTAAGNADAAAARANDAAAEVEGGTAPNASLLGNKPPEYYLTPVNLLDNSNFAKPIAQAGLNGKHGTVGYAADRWLSYQITVAPKNGFCRLTSVLQTARIMQRVSGLAGKTVTFAAKVNCANKFYLNARTVEDVAISTASWNSGEGVFCTTINVPSDIDIVEFRFYPAYVENGTGDVYWLALYEGAYTAESLPPYVPKPYAVELAECRLYYKELTGDTRNIGATSFDVTIHFEPMREKDNSNANDKGIPTATIYSYNGVEGKISKYEDLVWNDYDASLTVKKASFRLVSYKGSGNYNFSKIVLSRDL